MGIAVNQAGDTFHLYNDEISYIMNVLPNNQLGQIYFGKRIEIPEDCTYFVETLMRPMSSCVFDTDKRFSMEYIRQEYAVFGTSDYRMPAVTVLQENGSRISEFCFRGYQIRAGKPGLAGLPATYVENEEEAETLVIELTDQVSGLELELYYTIFAAGGIIARSARFINRGGQTLHLLSAMSLCLDLPDSSYDMIQFSGAWSRERYPKTRRLEQGIQSVGSIRGNSSHNHNPFIILKRPTADEFQGEAIGFSLIYSGNFLAQAEVDTYDTTRVMMGIHPHCFDWKLEPSEEFQTPEAVMVYTDQGLNHLSQTYHRLYQKRLARGYWRDRARPILINNWEATQFDFSEDLLVRIAEKAKESGVELFVLDDGWFGKRCNEHAGLGDWIANPDRLKNGITGLAQRIEDLGMKFGLWFEPEAVSQKSGLYEKHPDWALHIPGYGLTEGRHEYLLDLTREDVRTYLKDMLDSYLRDGEIDYIKWDMNRPLTEVNSALLPPEKKGETFHRYILGLYDILECLKTSYPDLLVEGCSGGGARFDPGMLYYVSQNWASDNTDAFDRTLIQSGFSLIYPPEVIGAHVSITPNHQTGRITPLDTRYQAARLFNLGYELDLTKCTEDEKEAIRRQTEEHKEERSRLLDGTFFRHNVPNGNYVMWSVVTEDECLAVVFQKFFNPLCSHGRFRLLGLSPDADYIDIKTGETYGGDELMQIGVTVPLMKEDFHTFVIHLKRSNG